MRLGIMGGTFDPVHSAHIAVAREVRARLALNEVLFVPAGNPWLKADRVITPAEHRLAMVRLAIAGEPAFSLSSTEIDREGPSYAVDTMAEMRKRAAPSDELYVILGWDSVADLPRWRDPVRLIELCRIVAVPRPGYPLPDLKALDSAIPGLSRRTILLDGPRIDISASEIRRRVARGLSTRGMVPEAVEKYISEHGLYTAPEGGRVENPG